MKRVDLSPQEQRLLLLANPLQAIQRPAFLGHPFRLAGEIIGSARSNALFAEELVMAMIGRGLLTVTQIARDLPDRQNPGRTFDRPFSVILSPSGVFQRDQLIADRVTVNPANDDHRSERAA